MLEISEGYDPAPGRKIIMADANGKLHDLSVVEFVIVQAARLMRAAGHEPDSATVIEMSGDVARVSMLQGWFTMDEYLDAVAAFQARDIEEEYKALLFEEDIKGDGGND